MLNEAQSDGIQSDGTTVWIHAGDGSTIARFGRNGIDVHRTATAQREGAGECLHCTHTVTTIDDWVLFQSLVLEHYGVIVKDKHRPARLKIATRRTQRTD